MEAYIVQKVSEEFEEGELPGGIHAMSSLGIGDKPAVPEFPYIVWKELPSADYEDVSETSNAELRIFQWFIYDHQGDFTQINQYLDRIKRVVKGIAPFQLEDGTRCSDASWGGKSMTFTDDAYSAAVRYGISRFVVNAP